MSEHSGVPHSSSFAVENVPGRLPVVGVTDQGLGNTPWVASLDSEVIVIDPERDPEPYLAVVEKLPSDRGGGVLVAETHLHADLVSGARAFADDGATAVPAATSAIAELRRQLLALPKDGEVVPYCRGPYCVYADDAVRKLNRKGFRARRLIDGYPEWKRAGLPVAAGNGDSSDG